MTASTSLPSTCTPGKPKPAARSKIGTRLCRSRGCEIAHWLFWQKNTTGALNTEAKTNASLTSPSAVAPSPKYPITASSAPSSWTPIA